MSLRMQGVCMVAEKKECEENEQHQKHRWIRTSRLSMKNSLSVGFGVQVRGVAQLGEAGKKVHRPRKVDIRLSGKGNSKLPWRRAGLLKSSR